jgi:hypothetical protein
MDSFSPAVPTRNAENYPLFRVNPAFKIVPLWKIQRVLILMIPSEGKLSHPDLVSVISSLPQGVPII